MHNVFYPLHFVIISLVLTFTFTNVNYYTCRDLTCTHSFMNNYHSMVKASLRKHFVFGHPCEQEQKYLKVYQEII